MKHIEHHCIFQCGCSIFYRILKRKFIKSVRFAFEDVKSEALNAYSQKLCNHCGCIYKICFPSNLSDQHLKYTCKWN